MIFVVLPVHNRKELTRECLRSLSEQDRNDFKVVVIDDGSSDGTSAMVQREFPEVVLLQGDGNLWWAGSINKGIKNVLEVCGPNDYILTINDDLVVRPNYLSSLSKAAADNPMSIIGSLESTMDNPGLIKNGGIECNWTTAKEKVINIEKRIEEFPLNFTQVVSILTGRGTLYPSQVFREVGLFDDQNIVQCADTELPIRANFKFGYRLIVCYGAIVYSYIGKGEDINSKENYELTDFYEYFFDLRSHFNLKTHYWIARKIAPNIFWFMRYLSLNILRTIGHFVLRLKLF